MLFASETKFFSLFPHYWLHSSFYVSFHYIFISRFFALLNEEGCSYPEPIESKILTTIPEFTYTEDLTIELNCTDLNYFELPSIAISSSSLLFYLYIAGNMGKAKRQAESGLSVPTCSRNSARGSSNQIPPSPTSLTFA